VPQNIVFVDDDDDVRAAVRKMLESVEANVRCFGSAEECLAHADILRCDLLITDVILPEKTGIELLIEVKKQRPSLPILVVTGLGDVPMAIQAMKAGAADFIEKPLDRETFPGTVLNLLEGNAKRGTPVDYHLTKTEMRILNLILEGTSTLQIAATLYRSPRTIEVHRRHILHKMGASNIVQLVRQAAGLGLFDMRGGSRFGGGGG
jgi:FixJ family two-component response regulator